MKKFGLLTGMTTLALTLVLQPALAADRQLQLKKNPQLSQTPAPTADLKPLQKSIRLSPAMQVRTKRPRLVLPIQLKQLEQQFNDLASKAQEYEVGVATMPQIQKECAEKSYSVQDQMAAGCNGNETLDQCMEKLVGQCVEGYSSGGMSWGGVGNIPAGEMPVVSAQSFREAARETAAKATALSQKLQQYAGQAMHNSVAWDMAVGPDGRRL